MLWFEIQHHAKNVELGEFVVMPNHVHGILVLGGNNERQISNSNPLVERPFSTKTNRATTIPKSG